MAGEMVCVTIGVFGDVGSSSLGGPVALDQCVLIVFCFTPLGWSSASLLCLHARMLFDFA